MSTHIGALKGDVADVVLLPGDPLRAKFIAENFLESPVCYNEVRGMFGFTGIYKGKRVSVQGTGMGQPSFSIYANELFTEYGVKTAIRVGTCGAVSPEVKLGEVILAIGASTDSAINKRRFRGMNFAPTCNFEVLKKAYEVSASMGISCRVGTVVSSDLFYDDDNNWKLWASYGALGIEMETAELYTLAAKYGRRALGILTVSDNIATGEATSAKEREQTFTNMMKIALDTAVSF